MRKEPSHRARFLAGLAVALAIGVGLSLLWVRGARRDAFQARDRREAVASLRVLVDLVERAGIQGDAVRAAVAAWQGQQEPPAVARVVVFQGIQLEASTDPADAGERAAPRRLSREEKPLFDRGQRLRGAVKGNREGGASKPEIEVDRLAAGRLHLAAPIERGGEVVGHVEIETPPPPPLPAPGLPAALLAVGLPLLAFAGIARATSRRGVLAPAAFGLLAVALLAFGAWALGSIGADRLRLDAAVGARARALAAQEVGLLAQLGLPADAAPRPGSLDVDVYRRPTGLLTAEGEVDPVRSGQAAAEVVTEGTWALGGAGVLALLVLAAVGLGAASRLGSTVSRHRQAYAYTLPAMVGMLLLVFFPFAYAITISFTDYSIYNSNQPLTEIWVGLENYGSILGDFGIVKQAADGSRIFNFANFYWTLGFTILWTVTNVAIGVSVGLLLALVLNTKGLALRPIYRVLFILPWAMPNYIPALIWKGMFHRQFGVVNHSLALVGLTPISWFDQAFSSYLTALATNGWLSFPFMMVISLGALQSISADLYEAARVDGATRWQQFRSITLPSLKPALVPAVIISVVWTFNMFNIVYLVTAGQPGGATEILVTQAYKLAFEQYRYGYAAAYSTVIFLILLVYGVFQNRVTRATEGI
ncbi:MAG TPA: sugar ABC transporter permease [Anaeromyxobacteraceae bacterium]|nr:sugar ABC transporter permease [Anaeromyxobacteraceae bacterium]